MPRLQLGGLACAPGTGLGAVSVNRTVLYPTGSDANWLTFGEVIFQGCDQTCQLLVYELATGQIRVADGQGANWLRAKDGGWAAWLNGQIRTSAGWVYPQVGYLADVADGQVWLADDMKQSLRIYTLAGAEIGALATGPLGDDATHGMNVRVRDGLLLYQDAYGWHLHDAETLTELTLLPRTQEHVNYAVPLTVDGEPWLLERTNRLTLRPATSLLGYVVTEELCYGADAVADETSLWVSWATTQGELPDSVRIVAPDLTGDPIDLDAPPHTDVPHTDHSDVPHSDHADVPHSDHADTPHDDIPPHDDVPHTDTPEPSMDTRSMVSLDGGKTWVETREMPHQDSTQGMGPILAVQRVSDDTYLRANQEGALDWATTDAPGTDERWISVPGAYVGVRECPVVVPRAGSWTQ